MNAEKKITGRQVFFAFAAAFGVIIAVNFTLAYMSVSTFPGLEVRNSYVASQSFEAERDAQAALGWTSQANLSPTTVTLAFLDAEGNPVFPLDIRAKIGRATHAGEDRDLDLERRGDLLVAEDNFAPGNWTLFLTASAPDGTAYRQRYALVLDDGA